MGTDTTVNNLIINKLTKALYDAIANPSDTELYLVPDEIDSTPTLNSTNPVTSGGVYLALLGKKGDKGDKGDPLTYDDLTEAQKAEIALPAAEQAAIAVQQLEAIHDAIDDLDPSQSTSDAIVAEAATRASKDAELEANLNALGLELDEQLIKEKTTVYENFSYPTATASVSNWIDLSESLVAGETYDLHIVWDSENDSNYAVCLNTGRSTSTNTTQYLQQVEAGASESSCSFTYDGTHIYFYIWNNSAANSAAVTISKTVQRRAAIITEEDVVDSLESTDTGKPLSANQGKVLNDKLYDFEEGQIEVVDDRYENENQNGGINIGKSFTSAQTYNYKVTFSQSVSWDGGFAANKTTGTISQRGTLIKTVLNEDSTQTRYYQVVADNSYSWFRSYTNGATDVIIEFFDYEDGIIPKSKFIALDEKIDSVADEINGRIDDFDNHFADEVITLADVSITTKANTWSDRTLVELSEGDVCTITCTANSPVTSGCGVLLRTVAGTGGSETTISSFNTGESGTKVRKITISDPSYKYLCVWSKQAGNVISVNITKEVKGDIIKRLETIEGQVSNGSNPESYGAVYDGTTDCSSALQTCLDKGGDIVLNGYGVCLLQSNVYITKSNTRLVIGDGITIKRGSNVSGALIRNAASEVYYDDASVNTNILDKVVIEGGTIDLNNVGGLAIFLCDISNFELRNIKIKNSTGFGLLFANVYGFRVDNILFDYSNPTVNTDGIHFRGDIHNGIIQHICGNTGDDLVSLTPTGDYNTQATETRRGTLENVVVRDLFGKSCMCAIKLNTGTNKPMKRIVIDGIYGHYTYNPISIGTWRESAVFEDITVTNVHCICDNSTNASFEGFIRIADWHSGNTTVINNLMITSSHIRVTNSMNIIRNVGQTIRNLVLSDIVIEPDDIDCSGMSVIKGGTVSRIVASNIVIAAPATANKIAKFLDCTSTMALMSNSDIYVTAVGTSSSLYKSNVVVNGELVNLSPN